MIKFRKGDIVSVQCVVKHDSHHDTIYLDHRGTTVYAQPADVTMVTPRIDVGDTVCCPQNGWGSATVLAIAEDHLWVSYGSGNFGTWLRSLVQRVDPEIVAPEAIEPPPATGQPVNSQGDYYASDGTLMNADGTRSIFDDVDHGDDSDPLVPSAAADEVVI